MGPTHTEEQISTSGNDRVNISKNGIDIGIRLGIRGRKESGHIVTISTKRKKGTNQIIWHKIAHIRWKFGWNPEIEHIEGKIDLVDIIAILSCRRLFRWLFDEGELKIVIGWKPEQFWGNCSRDTN